MSKPPFELPAVNGMQVILHPGDLIPARAKTSIAIGMFDGVHLGHQQVIRQAIADAQKHHGRSVAVTFDKHPSAIVAPSRSARLVYSLPHKLRTLAALGVNVTWLIQFDKAFSQMPPGQFIRDLAANFGPLHSICVGSHFTFGHKRAGNVDLLRDLGSEIGFQVHGLAAVALDGKTVSSTRIREAIRRGDLDQASQMLGRPYSIAGRVMSGNHLGRQLGFPTANIDAAELELPPTGVYAIHAKLSGQLIEGVLNIGFRPTLQEKEPSLHVEAHLLNFTGDLYGQELEVIPLEKLRDEKRFADLAALRKQIQYDIQLAQGVFGSVPDRHV